MNINTDYTIRLGNRNIVKIMKGSTTIWEKSTTPVVTPDYFYIENTNNGDNTLRVTVNPDTHYIGNHAVYLEYSKDKISWTRIHLPSTPLTEIPMTVGQKVYFRNDNGYFNYLTTTTDSYTFLTFFNCTNSHNVGGEISTLLNYKNSSVPCSEWCFYHLFSNNQTLVNATNLKIPQNIDEYCCYGMFYGCTGLTTAPALPATTLARECYRQMFFGCTSLTTAPALPATTLVRGCYENMFGGCTSLTTAPALPAKNLTMYCYYYMFYGCTSLNSVTIYADNAEEGHYYLDDWLSNVASTGTFYNNGSASYVKNSASGIPSGWTEVKPSTGPDYFYLENVDSKSGNVSFKFTGTPSSSTIQQIEYSKDKTNWTPVTLTANTTTNVPVSVGKKVYFRNSNGKCSQGSSAYLKFGSDINTNTGGELYTLLDYTDENISLPNYAFTYLFYQMNKLKNASDLVLRWTTLANNCYSNMFQGCSSLTTVPSLPATTLANNCYSNMFSSCSSLTTAPSLPATTLVTSCYSGMFSSCTSLTTVPSLPATTLATYCYDNMFFGCTSLTTAPTLPSTTLATACYAGMFSNCNSLTTAPTLPSTTLATACYAGMFIGCSSLTTAPTLPAITLVVNCYRNMFKSCSSLNSVTTYADDISASNCLTDWLNSVAATGTFYNNGSASYVKNSASGIPQGWTEVKPSTEPDYFYLENVDSNSGNVSFIFEGTPSSDTIQQIEWSKDKTNWTTVTLVANRTTNVPVNAGEKVYFRNDNKKCSMSSNYIKFGSDINTNTGGELYTLLDYTDENVSLPTNYVFSSLFNNMNKLIDASGLVLRWTTLTDYCYIGMFYNCSSLTSVPSLPATTLKQYCYSSMFSGCSSLTTAKALPATTLADRCYETMFNGCTSLTTPPTLPSTTLASGCYYGMFQNCTALTTSPELPATTLVFTCYYNMFSGCSSLNSVTTYADDISARYCLKNWLSNVASTGTLWNKGTATYPTKSTSGIPRGWVELY